MARSMLSLGMLTALASLIAKRRRMLESGSPPPILAATMIAFDSFVHSLPRLASTAALRCLIFAQGEWPAIGIGKNTRTKEPRTKSTRWTALFGSSVLWFLEFPRLAGLLFRQALGGGAADVFVVSFFGRRRGLDRRRFLFLGPEFARIRADRLFIRRPLAGILGGALGRSFWLCLQGCGRGAGLDAGLVAGFFCRGGIGDGLGFQAGAACGQSVLKTGIDLAQNSLDLARSRGGNEVGRELLQQRAELGP